MEEGFYWVLFKESPDDWWEIALLFKSGIWLCVGDETEYDEDDIKEIGARVTR